MFLERKSASTRLPKKMMCVIEEARAYYRSKVDENLSTRTTKTDRAEADQISIFRSAIPSNLTTGHTFEEIIYNFNPTRSGCCIHEIQGSNTVGNLQLQYITTKYIFRT
jgi:hypothetical protein